ncbi:autophagy 2 [Striga hermonthica]|uniref:Autophagy-related protein 2 n=1 Tax=Striga hermonthica TaxID=68872 RepID=A0A9N7MIQ9_STRHE|nr:autophagy 2 [Striga hermonthica]
MFSWSITKSAEAMFSRWAVKRICKFLLKKKLGKFILGDIDLHQLDVQLGAGTIQLSDLALNVDYVNEKLGTAAVLLKEGSVGSLTVTMPWKDGGCRVEVDELEIVLAPRGGEFCRYEPDTASHCKVDSNSSSHGAKKQDAGSPNSGVSVDVHEGVKTIAKMVKWLLTSFHVKVKKLIVAFDPLLEDGNDSGLGRILVLRISEAECGTHISEDDSSSGFTTVNNFLGFSRLTNYVKFEGAVIELLHVDGLDHQSSLEFPTETSAGNWFSGYCSSGNMTTIISGENGGFSGNLSLSLPWQNGSLDIHKVNADLHLEPLEIRLQPSTVKCFIFMWGVLKGVIDKSKDPGHHEPSDDLSAPNSCVGLPEKSIAYNGRLIANSCVMEKEPAHNFLSESHLISDWVSRSSKDANEEEPDFGASVDQFFECFDGLRNSQSALGNSGMWNWSCSVFSAITAASYLASGSVHVSSEQQHVETNFNASLAKVSLLLSFLDEDQNQFSKVTDDMANTGSQSHRMCTQFIDLFLTVQVGPSEMNFEVIVQHIQLVDHLCSESNSVGSSVHGYNDNSASEVALVRKMQDDVQGAFLAFQDSDKEHGTRYRVNHLNNISLNMKEINRCRHLINGKDICGKDASVTLLKTSGATQCHVKINLGSAGASMMGPTIFTLKLPHFVCWFSFDPITMMLQFLKDMANCMETTLKGSNYVPDSEAMKCGFFPQSDEMKISHASTERVVEGHVFLLNARIFLNFPPKNHRDLCSSSSSRQVIAFDFISTRTCGKDVQSSKPPAFASSDRRLTVTTSCSLNFNVGDFYLFSITSPLTQKTVGSEIYNMQDASFSVEKIISIVNRTGLSIISMLWQEGLATGPWIAKKAKLLASSENGKKDVRKGCEFASVTTVKDNKNFEARSRQEIISTSTFLLHGKLPPVTISLGKSQYEKISGLITQVFEHFSSVASESVTIGEEHSVSQTSILVECESATFTMAIEPVGDVFSTCSELPGSWSYLTLQVNKFELLSVSNIGGIRSANFLWVAHGPGSLWGSITEGVHREFLLISCSESTMGRGGGGGSNVLSSRYSGSDIIHFCDPESNHNSLSITLRGATIVAIGGRMDWFTTIFSFFRSPSSELEQTGGDCRDKKCGSSFILHLVDVGLSYEPYLRKLAVPQGSDTSSNWSANESLEDFHVTCILAASSLKLSNTTLVDCNEGEYKIQLQDLGLLVRMLPKSELFGSNYSVDSLRKAGYVKVAEEAHTEALFRTNCENGHSWELECGDSHIVLNTCHDTTSALIRLAAQLQKLFSPDLRDYVVHLENRWNNAQQVHDPNDEKKVGGDFSPTLSLDKKVKVGNLMDQICEDVFQVDVDGHTKSFESHLGMSTGDDSSLVSSRASPSEENVPTFIEEYFVTDLRGLSGLALKKQSSDPTCYTSASAGESRLGNGGWYADTSLRVLENHASKLEQIHMPKEAVDVEISSSDSDYVDIGKVEGHILLKNMNVVWRMYGGSDWSSSFHNTSHTSPVTCSRDVAVCLELALCGIGFEYDIYPDGEISASTLSLTIQDVCLNDRSGNAPWKLVLGCYQSKKHPRKSSSKAVKLNLEAVRPDPSIRIEENRLRIAILPIRLHLHQSHLDFLIKFFGGKELSSESSPSTPLGLGNSGEPCEKSDNVPCCNINEAFLTYFQKFEIGPMLIRVDYSPCHVDLTALRGGKYVELVNLVPWKGVELQLKHVQGVGLYGWGSVCETIFGEWLEDISKNQIHKLLKGLPPIKSLFAVGTGAAKLVSLPVKNYKKDHRLLKGMQRGTFAFLRSISLEAIGLGVHLAAGAHNVLLQAEYILASIPPSVPWPVESKVGTNVRLNQPNDAQQGIQQAYQSISDGLGKSASALVQTPLKKYQRGGSVGSALATAVQSAPAAAIAPASGAARAVHCALLGFRNSLDPEHKRESVEKYMGRTPPREFMQ